MGELLNNFLKHNKKDLDTIGKSLKRNLERVEEEILSRQKAVADSEHIIRDNAINIKVIADATGISRKTFYNNELLAAFVNANSTVDKTSKEELQKVKSKLEDTEAKLYKIIEKDIDKEILFQQINKLQQELEVSHKRIKSLEKQHEDDMKKLKQPVQNSYEA